MKPVLLDTGVIIALLDKSERFHHRCVKVVTALEAPLITCEAVIAESCYLLRNTRGAVDAILENVERGIFQVAYDMSTSANRLRELTKKYADIPMDLADACLVHLAEDYQTNLILTLDADFSIFRWARNKPFKNLIGAVVSLK